MSVSSQSARPVPAGAEARATRNNTSGMNPAALKEAGLAFWEARKPSERNALIVGAIVIVAALLYALVIAPAIDGRRQLQTALPSLRQQAAELQLLSQTALQLGDASAAPAPAPTRESVESSLRDRGLKAQSVVVEGGLVRLQFTSASFSTLLEWLSEARNTAQLAVADANIVAQAAADTVDATVTLRQQKSASE